MEVLELKDEEVRVIEEAEGLPQIKKLKTRIMQNKKFFNDIIRYVFYLHSRKSPFRDRPPEERRQKIMKTFFSTRNKRDFENSKGYNEFLEWYLDFTKSYKEKMYENHLADIEQMGINMSKIPFTRKKKIIKTVKVKHEKEWFDIDVDTEIEIDNTAEKLASLDLMTKLIEKEEFLKKKIEEEYIKGSKKVAERRLFDITTKKETRQTITSKEIIEKNNICHL